MHQSDHRVGYRRKQSTELLEHHPAVQSQDRLPTTMSQEAAGPSATPSAESRKRKVKFSEKELEYLIAEVSRDHDQLFGKHSLKVPENEKRRIWVRIRTKVNAVGVTNRSIDDLKKRWYDLRSRAKERIAERFREARSTGGGPSTVPANTPLEDLVEDTIRPEAVVGVTQLDTSGTTDTTQGAAADDSEDSDRLEILESPVETEGDSQTAPAPTTKERPAANSDVQGHAPAHIDEELTTPPPRSQPQERARLRAHGASSRARQRIVPPRAHMEPHPAIVGVGIEAQMLRVNRRQAQHMAGMHLQMQKMARNIGQLTDSVHELTRVVKEGNQLMVAHQDVTRRRHRQLLTRLSAYTRSNHIIGNATSQLSRRSFAMQVQLVQCCADVARALEQVTTAVANQQASTLSTPRGGDDASEGASSLSSLSVPVETGMRRSSRSTTAAARGRADVGGDGDRRLGVRGSRR